MTDEDDDDRPRPIYTPRLDRKIEAARRRAEAERMGYVPAVQGPEKFEKGDRPPDDPSMAP